MILYRVSAPTYVGDSSYVALATTPEQAVKTVCEEYDLRDEKYRASLIAEELTAEFKEPGAWWIADIE